MSASSASAWSGKSLVDNTYTERPGQIVLNNNLGALHSVAGLNANQSLGDVFDVMNRGTAPLVIAAEDTAAAAHNRFVSAINIPAGGKARIFYNGTRWEPFSDGANLITKVVAFVENATNTIHTGTVPIPPGAILHGIQVLNPVLWTGGAAVMKVGDTADDDGYFIGVDLKATDLLVGEVMDTNHSTLWGGKEGAYLVAASGRRGAVSGNLGKYYAAGSNITGIITVTTPATTVGRTFMIVQYSLGGEAAAAVPTGP